MICEKETFENKKDAKEKLASLRARKSSRHTYTLYKCEICGKFHITTKTKIQKAENSKLKYPIFEGEKKKDIHFVMPVTTKKKKPEPEKLSADKIMTKEQAAALKRLVDNNKYLSK